MKQLALKLSPLLVLAFFAVFITGHTARAFFDEITSLRAELTAWETAHAADFSDVIARLETIAGPVFTDVQSSDWFNPYVAALAEWGIVSGYRDAQGLSLGLFKPANLVTIAEVLKMTLEAAKIDEALCVRAPQNVQAVGHWSETYVACAEERGMRLFQSSLSLNRPATRAEVLVIVHDAFGDPIIPLYAPFRDSRGHPFEADIAQGALTGIVRGDTDATGALLGTFRPTQPINRAEVAKIIYERMKLEAVEAGVL